MTNADASPVSYRLDGKEQLHVFDGLDGEGWDLWAIYHSHTHSDAYPSRRTSSSRSIRRPATSCYPSPTASAGAAVVLDRRRRGHRGGAVADMTKQLFTEEQVQRYARHIILPNVGGAGQRKLLDASVLVHRRRGTRLADRDVPGGRRGGQDRHRRFRSRRRLEPPAPDPAYERRRWSPEGGVGARAPARDQPDDRGRGARHVALLDERVRRDGAVRRGRRRHRQLPGALPGERRDASSWASRSSTARSTSSRVRRRCSCRARRRRAIDACSRSRRRRARCRVARRVACSACFPAWSARSRPPRRSS